MNVKEEIKRHRLPCGPMAVSIDGVCRRSLRDHFDMLLDKLTKETHPEGRNPEDEADLEAQDEFEEQGQVEETDEEKKERMLQEGKMKIDVKRELAKYEAKTAQEPEVEEEEEETDEEAKKRMIKEGKLKVDVKKVVQKYEDKEIPKPKLQGNSKMLQDPSGKIKKR